MRGHQAEPCESAVSIFLPSSRLQSRAHRKPFLDRPNSHMLALVQLNPRVIPKDKLLDPFNPGLRQTDFYVLRF